MKDSQGTSQGSIHQAVDALFDGELSREEAKRLLARADASTCEDVAKTHRIVSMLKAQPAAPDLTGVILSRVEGEREFLGSKWRRLVRAGRMAVAACLLLGLLSVAVAQRMWPEATDLRHDPKPMSNLLRTTEVEAAQGVREIGGQIDEAILTTRQYACEIRDAVGATRGMPAKLATESRYVTAAPALDVHLKHEVSPVRAYWLAAPASEPGAEWQFVCTPSVRVAPAMGTGVSVQASLISVWTADAPRVASLRTIERQPGPSVPGLEFGRVKFPESP